MTCSAARRWSKPASSAAWANSLKKPGSSPRSGWLNVTPSRTMSLGRERDFAEGVEERHSGVAHVERDGLDERAREDHVAGLGRDAVLVQLVGQPRDGVDGVAHDGRGHTALLDAAVDREGRADAADVDVGETSRAAAEDDPSAGGGIGDAVDEGGGAAAVLPGVDDLDARQ